MAAAAARAGVEQDSNRTERASKAFSLIVRGCLATTILTFQNMAAHKKNSTNHDSHILEHRPTPETSYTSTSFYVVTHYKSKSSYTILVKCVEKKRGTYRSFFRENL